MADKKHYTFLQSRNGKTVPAITSPQGNVLPLHSMIDPVREAERLVSTIPAQTGFVIFLGLGGGYAPQAVLANTDAQVVVIDFNQDGITELLSSMDFSGLLKNERFTLLTDPQEADLKKLILENYKPAIHGGIKVIPLRTKTETDRQKFDFAAAVIQEAIESAAADYSVQAHFGKRWFSNILRNIKAVEATDSFAAIERFSGIHDAAIVAAGPSLDRHTGDLLELKSRNVFIICCDTALPVLLHNKIEPDAVVSIDCQFISYYHFIGLDQSALRRIPLFLDITSPSLVSGFSSLPVFLCGGHPLAHYISRHWKPLPVLDTSGGNVAYACLSLAELLGVQNLTVFGADFSYIRSSTYARGSYVFPFFEKKQNRLSPLEALHSSFLYRSPFLPPENPGQKQERYETAQLRFYRKKFEEKAAGIKAQIKIKRKKTTEEFHRGEKISAYKFLEQYRRDVLALSVNSLQGSLKERHSMEIFFTLLPLAAALKKREPALRAKDLIEESKKYCAEEIDKFA